MAKRKIITVDEDLCNGCGECITACAEGALKLVDGKARLVKEQFCDGFGDCIGDCPTGALKIVEKDVPDYDPDATRTHVAKIAGPDGVMRFDEAARRHGDGAAAAAPPPNPSPAAAPAALHAMGGCPGSRMRTAPPDARPAAAVATAGPGLPPHVQPSELRQWPVQIHLVQPGAPFFKGRELVVMSTCGPIASADVHWRFLRGRSVVVGCPKLDDTAPYAEKLGAILRDPSIPKVIVVRMEVPCCGGLTEIVREAVVQSGRRDLAAEEVTLGLDGDVRATAAL
jgi:NAD-dependent dihydropyrimidine dehydrogenase PreA subunit